MSLIKKIHHEGHEEREGKRVHFKLKLKFELRR